MRYVGLAAVVLVLATFGSAAGAVASDPSPGVTAIRAPLPRNAGSRYDVVLAHISCASPEDCVATGNLYKPSNAGYGVLLVEKGGNWTVSEPPLPGRMKSRVKSGIALGSVSCPAVGRCVAVAAAQVGGRDEPLILTQRPAGWRETVLRLPAGAKRSRGAGLTLVSCPSPRNCTAAGTFSGKSGAREGLLVNERAGRWARPVAAALPGNAVTHTKPRFAGEADEIDSLSCPSTRNCAAVGIYSETHGSPEGLLLTTTRGRWTRGIEAQLPGNAAPPDGSYLEPVIGLGSVSCGSPNDCTATGGYADDQSNQLGMTLSEHMRRWAPGEETPLPADAGPNPQQGNTLASPMNAIACPSPGMCSAVGYYLDKSGHNGVLLLSEQTGAWTPSALVLPPGADAALGGGLVSLACPSAGNCLAVGYDNTGINRWKPMLATEQGGHWIQGIAAALPSGVGQKNSGDLESVACPSATTCVAVGSYGGIGGTPRWGPNWHGLIVTFRSS